VTDSGPNDDTVVDCGVSRQCVGGSERIGDSEVGEIVNEWERKNVMEKLSELKDDERERVMESVRVNGPVFSQVVHDQRGRTNVLVARTKDLLFVYDLDLDAVSFYSLITRFKNSQWYERDCMDILERWHHCDRQEFATQLERLKIHACACYSVIMRN